MTRSQTSLAGFKGVILPTEAPSANKPQQATFATDREDDDDEDEDLEGLDRKERIKAAYERMQLEDAEEYAIKNPEVEAE